MSTIPTIGWSDFARKQHRPGAGNSFTTLPESNVLDIVRLGWQHRTPGHGEMDLSRKVVVPVEFSFLPFFSTPFVDLTPDLPVRARVAQRQQGEDYYIETYVDPSDCAAKGITLHPKPAKRADIVLYSAEALLENDGTRSTDCEWEIVCILASEHEGQEPMRPLTMARNQLAAPGGTKSNYTPEQFAEAIMYWSAHKGVRIMSPE